MSHHRPNRRSERPDPRVLRPVRQIALAGLALVLVWPAARGDSQWIGWWPMWLVGMPMLAWWSLYRFALPTLAATGLRPAARRRRRPQAQQPACCFAPGDIGTGGLTFGRGGPARCCARFSGIGFSGNTHVQIRLDLPACRPDDCWRRLCRGNRRVQ